MKQAWCKTAQIVLDLLGNNCDLRVCIHPTFHDHHGYVWNNQTGELVRFLQETIVKRLISDGFVVETSRAINPSICSNHWQYPREEKTWMAIYRLSSSDEDPKANALKNREKDALFHTLMMLQKSINEIQLISPRSNVADHLLYALSTSLRSTTKILANAPESEVQP